MVMRAITRKVGGLGGGLNGLALSAGYTLRILSQALRHAPGVVFSRRGFRSTVGQMYFSGVKAIGVTTIVGAFVGMIMALQLGIELRKWGEPATLGFAVALTICREMGPIMTAIILTAMVGSTIAAEIGTMKVSEEVDALEVMAIDPVRLLVTPRVVAVILMTTALTVLVDLVGLLGGGLVAVARFDVPLPRYFEYARDALEGRDFLGFLPKEVYAGLVKAMVFGALISSVACSQGLRAKGGALGVGRAVRRTVVTSIILILVFAYLMTAFFFA
jgi:phospholipid/cholesterol/gamma-HCH transport system permease protein